MRVKAQVDRDIIYLLNREQPILIEPCSGSLGVNDRVIESNDFLMPDQGVFPFVRLQQLRKPCLEELKILIDFLLSIPRFTHAFHRAHAAAWLS